MYPPKRPNCAAFTGKILLASLISLMALLALGCGRSSEETTAPPAAPPTGTTATTPGTPATTPGGPAGAFKVALVMSGKTTDNGWNTGAFNALKALRKEFGLSDADSPYVDNQTTPGQEEENLRDFARQGYNVVIGHGTEYQDIALKLENDFPKTWFVISAGTKAGKNTMPIPYQLEDGAYLLGMLAAGMTKTGKIGIVGPMPEPPIKQVFAAFEAGAKAEKPDVTVIPPVYTQSWDDIGAAKQSALALINQGADVIMQDVDTAAQGVFNAVEDNKDKGVYALGANSDQNSFAPDVVLASAPIYIDKSFVDVVKQIKAGNFTPSVKPFDMKSGYIGFVLNPQLEAKIPADLKAKLEDTQKKITDGSFTVPKGTS
jgi:basic membrane lipoprotein Med (substrate-binding protein (PBP1-ABC) superfamily)